MLVGYEVILLYLASLGALVLRGAPARCRSISGVRDGASDCTSRASGPPPRKQLAFGAFRQRPERTRDMMLVRESALRCPVCGHVTVETMPIDACQWFYECKACHALLKPKPGHCCVFCSFGSVACPSMQKTAGMPGSCC